MMFVLTVQLLMFNNGEVSIVQAAARCPDQELLTEMTHAYSISTVPPCQSMEIVQCRQIGAYKT